MMLRGRNNIRQMGLTMYIYQMLTNTKSDILYKVVKDMDNSTENLSGLDKVRTDIDRINDRIVELLAERMKLAEIVVEEKRKTGLPIVNKEREEKIIRSVREKARTYDIDEDYIEEIFRSIIRHTIEWENRNYDTEHV